ncbi:arp2/3 complex-activating protein rickA-like isoform X2 [Oncorhynchus mykiss]|uniref:arp2/3 complex-activating protein rickA-like isoform X2 n=1 Tax=Oncorhynchus mykiss TaxID=8022 RepID=UPI001878E599|nr:arp2/3 complex-activating protein rickA-like isoform X2 [Oncorhynchus mykiss]
MSSGRHSPPPTVWRMVSSIEVSMDPPSTSQLPPTPAPQRPTAYREVTRVEPTPPSLASREVTGVEPTPPSLASREVTGVEPTPPSLASREVTGVQPTPPSLASREVTGVQPTPPSLASREVPKPACTHHLPNTAWHNLEIPLG